jgi:hypothetical protein
MPLTSGRWSIQSRSQSHSTKTRKCTNRLRASGDTWDECALGSTAKPNEFSPASFRENVHDRRHFSSLARQKDVCVAQSELPTSRRPHPPRAQKASHSPVTLTATSRASMKSRGLRAHRLTAGHQGGNQDRWRVGSLRRGAPTVEPLHRETPHQGVARISETPDGGGG